MRTMTNEDRCEAFRDLIERVSKVVSREYPDVEAEDLSQELYVFVLSKPQIQTPDEGEPAALLMGAAKIFARKQRALNLTVSPQYSYRQSDIRKILESMMYYDQWQDGYVPEDDPSEYSQIDGIIARTDIRWAIDLLPEHYKGAILSRFRDGIVPQQATPAYGKLDRALRKLTDTVNSYKRPKPADGPGTRKAISNAKARFISDTNWDS